MFDLSTFELQDSIARYNQNKMLEAQKIAAEERKKILESVIDNLTAEYRSLYETEFSAVTERKFIVEQATIAAVKNVIYNIFESALLLDENVKEQYRDNIKYIFEANFNKLLEENNVKTLAQFKNFISNSHKILREVLERAHEFVSTNESIYHDIIKTNYSSTSLDKLIVEAFNLLSEADADVEKKKEMIKNVLKALKSDIDTANALQAVSLNKRTVKVIGIISALMGSIGTSYFLWVINPLLAILGPLFSLGGFYIGNKVGEKLVDKINSRNDGSGFKEYRDSLIKVRDELSKLLTKLDKGSKEYTKIQEKVDRANELIEEVNEKIAKIEAKKSLREASYIEFLTEAEHILAVSVDNKDLNKISSAIKSRMKDDINSFDPFKALEDIKIINKLSSDDKYYDAIMNDKGSGAYTVYLIIRGLKSNKLSDSLESQYILEAKKYSGNLEKIISRALRNKADSNPSVVTNIQRQKRYLDAFIKQYELNKDKAKTEKLIKENEYSSMFIDKSAISINNFVTNIMEAANFVMIYETSESDMDYFIKLIKECGCNPDDPLTEDDMDEIDILVGTVKNEVGSTMPQKCACMEAAAHEKLYMANVQGLSESVSNALKSGNYPKFDDFLDEEEKSLLDTIATVGGKDKIVDVIKKKVVDVIEKEEERTRKLEEEEEKLLAALNKKRVGEGIQESDIKVNTGQFNAPKSLFEAIVMNRSKKYIEESVKLGTGFDINMKKDTIMSEAITLYTIFETFNTINFGTFDNAKINKMTTDYYYGKN